jgi:hypothetical protein
VPSVHRQLLERDLKAEVEKLIKGSELVKQVRALPESAHLSSACVAPHGAVLPQLENRIYVAAKDSLPRANQGREAEDQLEQVERARVQWECSLNEELLSIARERGEPLACPRVGVRHRSRSGGRPRP